MKKTFLFLAAGFVLIYGTLHLVLASGPVQKRILSELRSALAAQGIEIEIESIEFSFFAPRIYLNRVSVSTAAKSEIQLEHPLVVDKIKLEFQPLGLLGKEIVFEQVALFHPKVLIPKADKLYQKIIQQVEKRKRFEVQGTGWPVVFRKIGVVDAQFDVQSEKPGFSVRSRNVTVFVSQAAVGQQNIEAKSNHLEIKRNLLELNLSHLDADIDFTDQSIRANRLMVEGPGLKLQWKGAYGIPNPKMGTPLSFHLSHETELDLSILKQIEELQAGNLRGKLLSSGTLHVGKENYSGTGNLKVQGIGHENLEMGDWSIDYQLSQKELVLKKINAQWSGGTLDSKEVSLSLGSDKAIRGEIALNKLNLREVFTSTDLGSVPLFGEVNGKVKISGQLTKSYQVLLQPQLQIEKLVLLNKVEKKDEPSNRILAIPSVDLKAECELQPGSFRIQAGNKLLGGTLAAFGAFSSSGGKISFTGQDISLTQLKTIAEIPFGGISQLFGELRTVKGGVNVEGGFDIADAMISDLKIGNVKGKVQYRDDLLSFSKLEVRALEAARGQGYVDFAPKDTAFRFDINLSRISMEQALKIFEGSPLPVQYPKGGELAGRVVVEGGKNSSQVEVSVDGQARSFEWYGEKWMSASFGLTYTPESFKVHRGVFLKRSGSLEVKANFDKKNEQLVLYSSGLRLEDLNHLGLSPLRGEVTGRVVFEGNLDYPRGNGELNISKIHYRDVRVPDAKVILKSTGAQSEYRLSLEKDILKGHLLRKDQGEKAWSKLTVSSNKADFGPYLSAYLGKDLTPLNGIIASGTWEMEGDFSQPNTIEGSAEIKELKLDFEGRPLVTQSPVQIKIDRQKVIVPKVSLKGEESELSGSFELESDTQVKARLEGKLALEFLQPFIPGIDYATGAVNVKLEANGTPRNYDLFGNVSVGEGVFRITGMQDEFRLVNAQLNVTPERLVFERFQGSLGGGEVTIGGQVDIDRFRTLSPQLNIFVSKAALQLQPYLKVKVTGDVLLKGKTSPYTLSGELRVDEATLSSLEAKGSEGSSNQKASLVFDLKAEANDKLFVKTEVIDAEFSGQFKVVGDDNRIGLLGKTEVIKGQLLFKDTPFDLISGTARFDRADRVYPRFSINGRSVVREQKGRAYQDYEVNLQVFGTADEYKIRLTSNPPLIEQDLISLLVLGVTTRGQEGNYFDLGTAIMGQSPIKSKIQSELGLDIKVQSAPSQGPTSSTSSSGSPGSATSSGMVPAVRIEKGLSKKTRLSYSNTLDQNQARELKLEQMLDEHFTLNATAGDRSRNNLQARPGDSFGVDVRYRFNFE